MASGGEELKITVVADDNASKVIDSVTKKTDKLEGTKVEIEVDANVKDVLSALDKVSAEVKETAETAEILGRALGPELAAKANPVELVENFKKMGLTLDQIKGNADELGGKLRELSDNDVGGKLGSSLGTARGQMDDLGKSADSSKSVLANMVGNSVQDVGALGGVAGSAGVAIGQLGEYMADAAAGGDKLGTILKNFGGVAAPLLGLAAATEIVSEVMGGINAEKAFDDEQVKEFTAAVKDGGTALTAVNAKLEETHALTFETGPLGGGGLLGLGSQTKDALIPLKQFGFSWSAIESMITKGGSTKAIRELANHLFDIDKANAANALLEAADGLDEYRENAEAANVAQDDWNDLHSITAQALEDELALFNKTNGPMDQFAAQWERVGAAMLAGVAPNARDVEAISEGLGIPVQEVLTMARDKALEARDAQDELNQAVADGIDNYDAMATRVRGLGTAFDKINRSSGLNFSRMAADTVDSFDALKEAIKDVEKIGSKPLVPTTVESLRGLSDESAKVIESIGGMRDAIQTELAAALEAGGGNFDAFRDKATFFRDEVGGQFQKQFQDMGLSVADAKAKTDELLVALGLTPDQVETTIKLSKDAEAMEKIRIFSAALNGLKDKTVTSKVAAAMEAGEPQRAWEILYAGLLAEGAVPVGTELQTPPNFGEIEAFVENKPAMMMGTTLEQIQAAEVAESQRIAQIYANGHPIKFPTELRPLKGVYGAGGTVGPGGGIAAEDGPEFINTARGRQLLLGPTVVAPGTRVTSTAATARELALMTTTPAPVQPQTIHNTTIVNVPRGYRTLDAATAAHRVERRSGSNYRGRSA